MVKVVALDTFSKNNIKAKELKRIPKAGEEFEVLEERLEILLGKNTYKKVFVKVIEEKENKYSKKKIEDSAILNDDLDDINVERTAIQD